MAATILSLNGKEIMSDKQALQMGLEALSYELIFTLGIARDVRYYPEIKAISILPRYIFQDMMDALEGDDKKEEYTQEDIENYSITINIESINMGDPMVLMYLVQQVIKYMMGIGSSRKLLAELEIKRSNEEENTDKG